MISLLDANVLVRFFIADKNPKYQNLYSFFSSIETGEIHVELKLIVLFQVIFVLKSYYKVPREQLSEKMSAFIDYKGIVIREKRIIRRSLELWRTKNIEIVDCYLIACLEGDGQNILYSYDRDFNKFDINRIEP